MKSEGLKILVVEDGEINLSVAIEVAERGEVWNNPSQQEEMVSIEVEFASDLKTAMELLNRSQYDGVITDLFFPREIGDQDKTEGRKVFEEIQNYHREHRTDNVELPETMGKLEKYIMDGDESHQPLGYLVVEEAYKRKIPVIVASSERGHGSVGLPIICSITKIFSEKHDIFGTDSILGVRPTFVNLEKKNTVKEWEGLYSDIVWSIQNMSSCIS